MIWAIFRDFLGELILILILIVIIFQNIIYLLQLNYGDYLFVYDVQDLNTTRKIAELDRTSNEWKKKKTFSSTENHSLLINFSTDDINVWTGFKAFIHYYPSNANCSDFLNKTELILSKAIDCNWIITTPSTTGTITIKFQELEVSI